MNPGITRSMMMETTVNEFLKTRDKKLFDYYINGDDFSKNIFVFLYKVGYRFCLRDAQIIYMLNGFKEIYEIDKSIRIKELEKAVRESYKEEKKKIREEKKKQKESKEGE